jgi:hypothetical protein
MIHPLYLWVITRRRHNSVVIFLKTPPWLSGKGPIGQLEFGGNDALLVLATALGLCLWGAMYGMAWRRILLGVFPESVKILSPSRRSLGT